MTNCSLWDTFCQPRRVLNDAQQGCRKSIPLHDKSPIKKAGSLYGPQDFEFDR